MGPLLIAFSGNLLPLRLFPDWAQTALLSSRSPAWWTSCSGSISATSPAPGAWAGIGLQAFWTLVLVVGGGRAWLGRVMTRLQVQGG